MVNQFPLYLGALYFCRWVSLFFVSKILRQESAVVCIKVVKGLLPLGDAFFGEW